MVGEHLEKQKSSRILPLTPLMFILQNFNPLTKLGLVVSGVDLSPFSLERGSNLFRSTFHTGQWVLV